MEMMTGFPDQPEEIRKKSRPINQQHHLIATARGESVDALQFGNLAQELARGGHAMTTRPGFQIMHPIQTPAVDPLGSYQKIGQTTHNREEQDRPQPGEGRIGGFIPLGQ